MVHSDMPNGSVSEYIWTWNTCLNIWCKTGAKQRKPPPASTPSPFYPLSTPHFRRNSLFTDRYPRRY